MTIDEQFQHLENLVTDMKESLEREMNQRFDQTDARLDHMNARLEKIGGLLNGGTRALARMIDWSNSTDVALADVLRRLSEVETRLNKMKGDAR